MAVLGEFVSRPLVTVQTSASGASNAITLPAIPEIVNVLHLIHVVYNGGTPGVKTITIAFTQNGAAVSVVYALAQTVSVITPVELWDSIVGDPNTVVTITAEALAANTSTMVVFYH